MKSQGKVSYATPESRGKWKETDNKDYLISLSRLVIIKDKKENTINSYIMTMVAETSYLESKNFQLWSNTYLKKDKDFAGYVFFKTLTGEFVNGWRMKKGKVIAKVNEKRLENKMVSSAKSTAAKSSTEQCTTMGMYEIFETCDMQYDYTLGEYVEIEGSCVESQELLYTWEECITIEDPDPNAGGGSSGSGSGDDFNPEEAMTLQFPSLSVFLAYINNLTFEQNINITFEQDGTHTTKFRVRFNYITTINININQDLKDTSTNTNYELNSLNTIYSGVTLGTSWTQSSYDYIIFNNTAIIDLYGSIKYNVFIQGVGTVYTDYKHYQMIVDIETGQQLSIVEVEED